MSEFKEGQKIVYEDMNGKLSLSEIIKITTKGGVRIKSNPSILFWDGNAKTGPYSFHSIRPATDADLMAFHRAGLIHKCRRFDWSLLSTDELKELAAKMTLAGI